MKGRSLVSDVIKNTPPPKKQQKNKTKQTVSLLVLVPLVGLFYSPSLKDRGDRNK